MVSRSRPGRFLRADVRDTLDTVGEDDSQNPLQDALAIGPDGTLWSPTVDRDGCWHLLPDGERVRTPVRFREPCDTDSELGTWSRAPTARCGWPTASARSCPRAPAGTTTIDLDLEPEDLAADASGGVWVSGAQEPSILHVDAAGTVKRFDLPRDDDYTDDVSVAPDGSAWFTLPRCRLLRVTPAGEMSTSPSPHSRHRARVRRGRRVVAPQPGAARAPRAGRARAARATSGRPRSGSGPRGSSISLRRLRRLGGFTVTVREPAEVEAVALYFDSAHRLGVAGGHVDRIVRARARRNGCAIGVSARRLRRLARELAAGHKPSVTLDAGARDAEGNATSESVVAAVRR